VDPASIVDALGYPAAGLGILIESAGIPFPGEALLLAAAAWAAARHHSIVLVILFGFAGATVAGRIIGRFVFDRWQLIDPTARSLSATLCQGDQLTAVGGGGRVITIDDRLQTIRSDTIQFADFLGLAPLADGVLVVGKMGTVERQDANGWGLYAGGIDEDLYAIAAFSPTSAWAVGDAGVTYRLESAGWRPVATGATATLRAIAARAVDDAVVVGDDGTVLVWDGAWKGVVPPVHVGFHAALRMGEGTYLAGDGGTLLRLSGTAAAPVFSRVDLGATCTLRALFARGTELWVIGSDGGHAGVWRVSAAGAVFHWGQCS